MHESQGMIDFNPDRLGHCIYLSREQMAQVVDKKIILLILIFLM